MNVAIKLIGSRPMALVLNTGHLKVSEHELLSFSVRKQIIKNDNSLIVIVQSSQKRIPSDFIANSQSRIIKIVTCTGR